MTCQNEIWNRLVIKNSECIHSGPKFMKTHWARRQMGVPQAGGSGERRVSRKEEGHIHQAIQEADMCHNVMRTP